ncbi:calcium-binding protein [Herbaspirillum sp. alder98]|uniref:calcium-binding protein n=1 Tax=Herbaspirillum sp. alder98 TaxID=2913096 RepID=UPI001CD8AEA6|nr:calcium-binding protein [Herbaspirillum sp. alder98]MCA1323186.1 hypothetical protein [Herbaspirillum sp. alder98]
MSYTSLNTSIPSFNTTRTAPERTPFLPYTNAEQVGDDLFISFGDDQPGRTIKAFFAGLDSNAQTRKLDMLRSSAFVRWPSTAGGNILIKGTEEDNPILGDDLGVDIDGEGGDDILQTGAGADRLSGGAGRDWLYGGAGNDELSGGIGNDELHGEAGNDKLDGGAGDDLLDGGPGDDRLDGGPGADVLKGGAGNDRLEGGLGSDHLYGGDGDDEVIGGAGDDILLGDRGNDVVFAGDGDDLMSGGTGNDYLSGGSGNDTLFGDAGVDLLKGDDGDDLLAGGTGNDILCGGAGNDRYLFMRGDGTDAIYNLGHVGDRDIIRWTGDISPDQLWFRKVGNNLKVSLIGTNDEVTIMKWFVDDAQRVERFELSTNNIDILPSVFQFEGPKPEIHSLENAKVDALVEAMSALPPPPLGTTSLPENYHAALDPVLAASWV